MPSSAINEPALYITKIKATDRAYAQRLRGKLDELRAFNTQLSNIRASFCSENGFTYSGVRKVLSDETRDKAQVKFELGLEWGYVRNILQTPFTELREGQLGHAAQFFVGLNTTAEIERFINAMAVPVVNTSVGNTPSISAGNIFPAGHRIDGTGWDRIPFFVCPQMTQGLMGYVGGGIAMATLAQMNWHPEDFAFRSIDNDRRHMIQQYALLTTISNMTTQTNVSSIPVHSVLVGGPSGPFSLRESDVDLRSPTRRGDSPETPTPGLILSFTEGRIRDVGGMGTHLILEPLSGARDFAASSKHISEVLFLGDTARGIIDRTRVDQLARHEFDFAASLDSAIRTYMATNLIGNLADAGGRVTGGAATFVLAAGSIGLKVWREHDNAMAAQQSINVMGDNAELSHMFVALGLEAVIVTNITGTALAPQNDFVAIPFPTAFTPDRVDAFVSVYLEDRFSDSDSPRRDYINAERPGVENVLGDLDRYFAWFQTSDRSGELIGQINVDSSVQRVYSPGFRGSSSSGITNTLPDVSSPHSEESFN